jgi:ribosomal-protein-alanine N-acetyltransferase
VTTALRTLTAADADAIEPMERELFGSDAWPRVVIDDELDHPLSYYRGVDEDGILVAYAGLRALPQNAMQGDIQTIAVSSRHRKQGLGRRLLHDLISEARRRGVVDLFLEVRADNEVAIGLYTSEGFREIDRRAGYYQPDGVDAIVMCRTESLDQEGSE